MKESSGCTRFNYYFRIWLSILLSKDYSIRKIAKIIGFHHSSVLREIKRNSIIYRGIKIYNPIEAEEKSIKRREKSRKNKIISDNKLLRFIEVRLLRTWSPDAISGYLKRIKHMQYVSHETIYKFIYKFKREWIPLLARGHRKRYRRTGKYKNRRKSIIEGRIFINERPSYIETKNTVGHYEADCLVSRLSKSAVLVLLERKTRLLRLVKLKRKSAEQVKESIVKALRVHSRLLKSITYDNGVENSLHDSVNMILKCKSYFCNPYHSWEKGSVEHVNGLIRRFIPKKTDLSKLKTKDLKIIEDLINNRPRKILDYKTPREMFSAEWCTQS